MPPSFRRRPPKKALRKSCFIILYTFLTSPSHLLLILLLFLASFFRFFPSFLFFFFPFFLKVPPTMSPACLWQHVGGGQKQLSERWLLMMHGGEGVTCKKNGLVALSCQNSVGMDPENGPPCQTPFGATKCPKKEHKAMSPRRPNESSPYRRREHADSLPPASAPVHRSYARVSAKSKHGSNVVVSTHNQGSLISGDASSWLFD